MESKKESFLSRYWLHLMFLMVAALLAIPT